MIFFHIEDHMEEDAGKTEKGYWKINNILVPWHKKMER